MKRFLLTVPVVMLLGTGTAYADALRCPADAGQRQPESALRQKLEAEGWQIRRVKIEHGCYEIYAIDAQGHRRERNFDPVTLAPVGSDKDD
ncbi:MAG: PepSY domain-containing protein [Thalassobaculum sp.]|uniref:PepSY domain-containing protein n=1 Tax=Thalassobaculum sp. TaxID=2022740 RepID=UPI0032EB6244